MNLGGVHRGSGGGRLHGSGKKNRDNIKDVERRKEELKWRGELMVWIKRGTRSLQMALKRRAAL
jgi:hypothetical protein